VRPRHLVNLVGAKPPATLPAVDHGIGEVVDVAARLPHCRVHQDGGVQADHVRPPLNEVAPPYTLDVVLQLDAKRPVVPARSDAAVDLAGLEDEAPALAQGDEGIHGE
jgi:hypothetical protein